MRYGSLPISHNYSIQHIPLRALWGHIPSMGGAVKNIICRNLNHCSVMKLCSTCQLFRFLTIQFICQFRIIFRLIHSRISRAVYNHLNPFLTDVSPHCLFVTNIELPDICKIIRVLRILFCKYLHFVAKLTIGTRH